MLEARGAFAEAAPLRRRGLEATERRLGPEHRETLVAVGNLAFVLEKLGKFSEAPLMCCAAVTVAGGWCCILCWEKLGKTAAVTVAGGWCCILCWEKLGKTAGKQSPHFQIISDFVFYIIEVR